MDNNSIRPLTRKEQLEWYIEFLKEQKALLEEELEKSVDELKLVIRK